MMENVAGRVVTKEKSHNDNEEIVRRKLAELKAQIVFRSEMSGSAGRGQYLDGRPPVIRVIDGGGETARIKETDCTRINVTVGTRMQFKFPTSTSTFNCHNSGGPARRS
jgi:hypothetical protein